MEFLAIVFLFIAENLMTKYWIIFKVILSICHFLELLLEASERIWAVNKAIFLLFLWFAMLVLLISQLSLWLLIDYLSDDVLFV